MKTNIKYVSSFLGVILMGPKESENLSFGREKKSENCHVYFRSSKPWVGEWQKKTIPGEIVFSGEKPIKDLLNNFRNRRYTFYESEPFCN